MVKHMYVRESIPGFLLCQIPMGGIGIYETFYH